MFLVALGIALHRAHGDVGARQLGQPAVGQGDVEVTARNFEEGGYLRTEGVLELIVGVGTPQVGVFAMHIVEDAHLGRVGHVARGAAGEHIMAAVADEVRRRLAGIRRTQADEVLGVAAVGAQVVAGELGANHLPVRSLEPYVGLARVGVFPQVEIAHAETFGLQALHDGVRPLKAVGLEDDEEAVSVHRLDPADPLARLLVVEDVGAVQRLRVVQWRERVHCIGLDDETEILPVVEISGAVSADAPRPDV